MNLPLPILLLPPSNPRGLSPPPLPLSHTHKHSCSNKPPSRVRASPSPFLVCSYPQALTVVGPAADDLQAFYVAASNNKEDIWVTRMEYSAF